MADNTIILGCMYFSSLCGTEMYYYELAKAYAKMGYRVVVVTNPSIGQLQELANQENASQMFKVVHMNSNIGPYMVHAKCVICSHVDIIKKLLQAKRMYKPDAKFITVHHSEIYTQEQPYIDSGISQYVGVRPEIVKMLSHDYKLENASLIWNPFDTIRFKASEVKTFDKKKTNRILFCGAVNETRLKCIEIFADACKTLGWKLIVVGEDLLNCHDRLEKTFEGTLEYYHPTSHIDDFVKNCDATCGVFIGRTTIEGWLMGKPAFVFDINSKCEPIGFEFMEVPDDLNKFDSLKVAENIYKL